MDKKIYVSVVMFLAVFLSFSMLHAQHMGPGMMGPGYGYQQPGGWNYCPNCGNYMGQGRGYGMDQGGGYGMGQGRGYGMGQGRGYGMGQGRGYGMGPGMMGGMMGQGHGMGPGMMGRGDGMGPGMMGPQGGSQYGPQSGPQYQQPSRAMEEKDVKLMLENYLKSTRNPNLKLGKIQEKDSVFEAEILTKDGSLVDKIAVDKATGWMRSVY